MADTPSQVSLEERARRALDLVHHDPAEAARQAADILRTADGPVRLIAQWAQGRAQYELGDIATACVTLGSAIAEHARNGPADVVAQVRMSLAVALVENGRTDEAFSHLDLAEPHLSGGELGRLLAQRAFVHNHLGRLPEAIEAADRAIGVLRSAGDRMGEVRLLVIRAVSHLNVGGLDAAEQDLLAARPIALELDHHLVRAVVEHNLGVVHARRGEIPEALRRYDEASTIYQDIGRPGRMAAILEIDRAETLLHAALHEEAVEVARRAVRETEEAGNVVNLADAQLLLARSLLDAGHPQAAKDWARAAESSCRAGKRQAWAAVARLIVLEAEVALEPAPRTRPVLLRRARRLADEFDVHGWAEQAASVRALVAEWALRWGRNDLIRDELAPVKAMLAKGRPANRAHASYVLALAHQARGEHLAAQREVRRGLRIIDEHRDSLGASDLRARAAALATDLTELGLHTAVERGSASTLFTWAERSRAWALRRTRVRPPADPELSARLADIRNLESALRTTEPGSPEHHELRSRLARAEAAARDRARTAAGGKSEQQLLVTPSGLRAKLGNRGLVEYVIDGDQLLAVVATSGGMRRVDLGAVASVEAERDYLAAEIHRALRLGSGREAAMLGPRQALDDLLIAPLGLPASAELVIVPTGPLHTVLWGALPSLGEIVFSIVPSATVWAHLAGLTPRRHRAPFGMVLGPDLPGGDIEAEVVSALHPTATVWAGDEASTQATLDMLGRVRVAHLAAHGRFRRDSPLFSSFALADGPLTAYDLESLPRAPELLVLSGCEAGAQAVSRGDELLGVVSVLFGCGVRAVVAASVPVVGADAAAVMERFYEALHLGRAAADALTAARMGVNQSATSGERIASWSFACLGYSVTIGRRRPNLGPGLTRRR